jgi:hypothetical protein
MDGDGRVVPYVRHTIYNPSMTKFDPQNTPSGHLHNRRSIRLKNYDYIALFRG